MSYPAHIKHKAPQINLTNPLKNKTVIYNFYDILGEEKKPEKIAKCKICEDKIYMIKGLD